VGGPGHDGLCRTGHLRTSSSPHAAPKGKRVYLEIGDVHDYAKVTLNGKELGAHGWQPYRWDVTGALKKGANDLVIEVNAIVAGGRGQGGQPPAAAAPPPAVAAPVASPGLASMPSTDGPMAAGAAAINGTAVPAAAPGAAAGNAAGARRRTGAGGPGAAGAPPAGATGGAGRAPAPPAASGLLGPVRMVAY
jgi:hypothetical protein